MTHNIGDIPVQSVEEFSPDEVTRNLSRYKGLFRRPTTRGGSEDPQAFTLRGYAWPEGTKNEDDLVEDLMALKREAAYNRISLGNRVGFLSVKDVKSPKRAEQANMREYTITGDFHPAAQYEASVRIEPVAFTDAYEKGIVPIIPLPVGASGVRVQSPWGSISLPSPTGTITGADGVLPLYQPFPVLDWRTYGCAFAGATPAETTYDAAAYSGKKISLTHFADETITWTFVVGKDAPPGKYKVGFRVTPAAAAAGTVTVTVTGSTSGSILAAESHTSGAVAGTWETMETAEINLFTCETVTVTVTKATDDNVLYVNYGYLIPQNTCRVTFDCTDEYEAGECRVYDTVISGDTTVANWKRVYSDQHAYTGDMVFQNSLLRWTIKQATAWSAATTLTELVGGKTGTLYPVAFGTDLTDIVIDKILPNCIVLKARMDVGATATFDSLNDVETAEIVLTPAAIYFDLTRIGAVKRDWRCSLTDAIYTAGSAFIDSTGTPADQASPYYILGLSGVMVGMQKTLSSESYVGGTFIDTIEDTSATAGDYAFSLFMVPVTMNYNGTDFTLTKDNNDVERVFKKYDFSNDIIAEFSLVQGTIWSVDTANSQLYRTYTGGTQQRTGTTRSFGTCKMDLTLGIDVADADNANVRYWYFYLKFFATTSYIQVLIIRDAHATTGSLKVYKRTVAGGATQIGSTYTTGDFSELMRLVVDFDISTGGLSVYLRGVLVASGTITDAELLGEAPLVVACEGSTTPAVTYSISDISITPSTAFTDSTPGTNLTRYGSYAGTNTDDTTRIKMVTGAGTSAAVRAKEYRYLSGGFKIVYTLPAASGADNDSVMLRFSEVPYFAVYDFAGVRRDGSGNWNCYYGNTTTNTEGAAISGLADGDTVVIEVERDVSRGAWWCYIYENGTTKPTTPTGIWFSSISTHGYIGVNLGSASAALTGYLVSLEARAESTLGETNIPATETGFFDVDDGSVNRAGKYIMRVPASPWTYSTDHYVCPGGNNLMQEPYMAGDGTYECVFDLTWTGANPDAALSHFIIFAEDGTSSSFVTGTQSWVRVNILTSGATTIEYRRYIAGVATIFSTANVPVVKGTKYKMKVVKSGNTITAYFAEFSGSYGAASLTITDDSAITYGRCGVESYTTATGFACNVYAMNFSGTRHYFEARHRGAQIGKMSVGGVTTYRTRLYDGINYDSAAEVAATDFAVTASYGQLYSGGASGYWIYNTADMKFKVNSPYIIDFNVLFGVVGSAKNALSFGFDTNIAVNFAYLKHYTLNTTGTLYVGDASSGSIAVGNFTANTLYRVTVFYDGTTHYAYINGVLKGTTTKAVSHATTGYFGFATSGYGATVKPFIFNVCVDAYADNPQTGICVQAPSPTHGGRYDITESITKTLIGGSTIPYGVYRWIARKISTVASASNDYETNNGFLNVTDSNYVSIEDTAFLLKSTNTVAWTTEKKDVRIDSTDDAGDSIEFGIYRRGATSLNSDSAPATFVSDMQLIPLFADPGAAPLMGVGDMAFATVMEPSYIRRVEIKNIL